VAQQRPAKLAASALPAIAGSYSGRSGIMP
jgi:hypothetical protein